ncbi:glycosyltransferase family 39 protein [Leptolyngbya sp. FACHB-261]|nr:glycosyltransferase family 39 protein [Leptolyngbya sp. FACHB-261]
MAAGLQFNRSRVRLSLELLLVAAIVIGVVLRLLNLGTREFWYDEVVSLNIAAGQLSAYDGPSAIPAPTPLSDYLTVLGLPAESSLKDSVKTLVGLLKSLLGGEPHPLLFFLSQHFWLRLFGNSEVATRSLSALCSIAAMGCAYGLGRVVSGHRSGLLLAALLGVNPFYFFHSLNLRMYAPVVLWATLGAWALLYIIKHQQTSLLSSWPQQLLWSGLLAGSVAAGLLTLYLFAYWLIALAAVVLYLDRRHWWQHGLRLGAGVLLTVPWALWGTVKQLRNADVDRFSTPAGFWAANLEHLQNTAQVLGIHLLVGDWVTSLPDWMTTLAGVLVGSAFLIVSWSLWQRGERQMLIVALLLGLLPLGLALAVDVLGRKTTLGFGMGRAMIFMLPGCLLLITLSVERLAGRWREAVALALVLLYLTISVGDFSLRQRQGMHVLADVIAQEPTTPTLIAMSSRARGHILRLAYYLDPSAPVMLLAQAAPKVVSALRTAAIEYPRVIWLDSVKPSFFDQPATEAEQQEVQQILKAAGLQPVQSQMLTGTMPLDEFKMSLYSRPLN